MNLTEDQEDNDRLVVIYKKSRLLSRADILKILKANIDRDDVFKVLLETMNLKVDQQFHVVQCDAQAQGQEWNLDAIDRVINDLRHQPHTGAEKVPISVQKPERVEEAKKSLVRPKISSSFMSHADGSWQNKEDLSARDILTEDPSPSMIFDLAIRPKDLAGVPTIATEHAANYKPPFPVRQAETEPAILAPCSLAPAEPNGASFYAPSPALQSMMFNGAQGTYYERNTHFDELDTSDSGSWAKQPQCN